MSPTSLRKDILRLNPSRFEIGPVYTANPRDRKTLRKSTAFRPMAKELVFDIDLTDYDEIRTCCSKANICHKCWSFITMAIKVVDAALRQDFGFGHIMWVYSGRRGAHAWISDKRAREMDDSKRRAIAGYLEVIKGGAQSGKKVNLRRPLHPHIAYVVLHSLRFPNPNPPRSEEEEPANPRTHPPIAGVSKSSRHISQPTSSKPKTPSAPLPNPTAFSPFSPTSPSWTPFAKDGRPRPTAPAR